LDAGAAIIAFQITKVPAAPWEGIYHHRKKPGGWAWRMTVELPCVMRDRGLRSTMRRRANAHRPGGRSGGRFSTMSTNKDLDAVEFHDAAAGSFRARYEEKDSFKDRLSVWVKLFTEFMPGRSHVLDLGCGPGLMTKALIGLGHHVDAVDGSHMMLEQAKVEVGPSADIRFIQSYISTEFLAQIPENTYDHVVCSSVLEYLGDFGATLEALRRILKPGGSLIFSIPNKQSLFRVVETIIFFVSGWPAYRRLSRGRQSRTDIEHLRTSGWQVERIVFQGEVPLYSTLTRFLPGRYQKPMIIAVLRKPS
jgi:2-polyprenyl-3-methyl-5-hydroxy-6-metoxy-1,4-benzoquinol methylase